VNARLDGAASERQYERATVEKIAAEMEIFEDLTRSA
jgi:hypothetical protein